MRKLIEFKNIVKNFDGQVVLKGINLNIYENEFVTCRLPAFTGKHCQLFKIQHFSAFDDAYDRFLRSIAFPLWSMAVTDSRLCAFRYSNPLSTMQSHFFCSCMIW